MDKIKPRTLSGFMELPPDMVVHRFTGDGPKKILVAPMWSADKKMVLNRLNRIVSDL